MEKLLELEKKLKAYKAELEKNMGYEDVNGSLEQSEKHSDEKEDKRLIAEALDTHNEKKHDEDKDKDSVYKDMKIKKEESDVIKMEHVKFAKNGQWSLDKADSDAVYIENGGAKKVKPDDDKLPEIKKDEGCLEKGLGSKLDNAEHKAKVSQALGSIRQPATVTTAAGTKTVSPKEQVSNQISSKKAKASEAKAKAEAEAAERRASYKK